MVARLRPYTWLTVALMVLALLLPNIWGGCEKSPVSPGDNPAPIPITSDVKWQVVFSDSRARFPSKSGVIFDSSGTFGFAIGTQTYRTTDGGHSWIAMPPDFGGGLFITSKRVAYQLYPFQRTTDAGESWYSIPTPTSKGGVILPVTENLFYLIEYLEDIHGTSHATAIWKTENAGNSWTQIGKPEGDIYGLATVDGINLVVGSSPLSAVTTLYYSNDGGNSWAKANIDTTGSERGYRFYWVQFLSAKTAVCVANWSTPAPQSVVGIFRTSDGGANWNKVYETDILPYVSNGAAVFFLLARSPRLLVQVITRTTYFISYVYNSDDAGLTWTSFGRWIEKDQPYYYYFYKPTFAPPDCRIGISGPWMTQDGGKTWTQKSWYVANAAFLSPYEVIGVRDSVILRGTAP